jgi:hypothetical protein
MMQGLPSIGNRQGNFMLNEDYLAKANKELAKLDDIMGFDSKPKPVEDSRSMAEVFAEKRKQTTQQIEEEKSGPESVEERKARLLAQRDKLREAKKKQMQEELSAFNEKTKTKDSLFDELKKIDESKQPHNRGLDEAAEKEKRRNILKGVKQQIERDEKEASYRQQREQQALSQSLKTKEADKLLE